MFLIHVWPFCTIPTCKINEATAEFMLQMEWECLSPATWKFIHESGECIKPRPRPIHIK